MKTVTVRIDDSTYNLLKKAADLERRTLSNFIEHAAVHYVASQSTVTDEEMAAILKDESLVRDLRKGLKEARDAEKSPYELGENYLGKYESGMTDRSVNHKELIRQKLRPGSYKL
jgi:uncharacterized protein (DUF1778 family)